MPLSENPTVDIANDLTGTKRDADLEVKVGNLSKAEISSLMQYIRTRLMRLANMLKVESLRYATPGDGGENFKDRFEASENPRARRTRIEGDGSRIEKMIEGLRRIMAFLNQEEALTDSE